MKLFNNKPNYVKLDDDVSFQILRTNPKLSTNTKLVYDGKNLFMDAYPATPLLSTMDYQNYKLRSNGLFNLDIRKFLLGSGTGAYAVGQNMSDLVVGDTYDNQFETMYWCGAEAINSAMYPQELGFVAPLYLRKKLPEYFVIFKVDGMANTNLNFEKDEDDVIKFIDDKFDFKKDILNKAKIIKTFDLREGTPIGNYIKNYTEQKEFKFDRSIYVNFAAKTAYYYGIDRTTGVLTQKVENISEHLMNTDTTILRMDDWITSGFERNNLIYPYILNLEFLFDDNWTKEYEFARYFGIYCNAIDLYELEVNSVDGNELTINADEEMGNLNDAFYYIKDNKGDMFSIADGELVDDSSESEEPTEYKFRIDADIEVDKDNFMGFETSTTSVYCERIAGESRPTSAIQINKPFRNGDAIYLYNDIDIFEDSDEDSEMDDGCFGKFVACNTDDEYPDENIDKYSHFFEIDNDKFRLTNFSCKGGVCENAKALADCINAYEDNTWVKAYYKDNVVAVRLLNYGEYLNYHFDMKLDPNMDDYTGIKFITNDFEGGVDYDGAMFKIRTEDADLFFNNTLEEKRLHRYLRYGDGRVNSKVLNVIPYINENDELDLEYKTLVTDRMGKFVNISRLNQVEVIDKYYPVVGVLSFFPVKDFDFDTICSAYGNGSAFKNELDNFNKKIENYDSDKKESVEELSKYVRFFNAEGKEIDNEYEYYKENIIPELSVVNKTVPFISKWGYQDDAKDSCENPYRLNTSKIFGISNFSANTFIQRGDIFEYTHSMPYYAINSGISDINEYQYIPNPFKKSILSKLIDECKDKFLDENYDWFEVIFGGINRIHGSKRFSKKYSRFLNGDSVHNSFTLFRGVKFEIADRKRGEEVKSSRFNNYKFSFIYVPVDDKSIYFGNKVYFIKNDVFKFIVGIVPFGTLGNFTYKELEFNKSYVYGGCEKMIPVHENSKNEQVILNIPISDMFIYTSKDNRVDISNMKVKMPTLLKLAENYYRLGNGYINIKSILFKDSRGTTVINGGTIDQNGNIEIGNTNNPSIDKDAIVSLIYDIDDEELYFDGIFDSFNEMCVYYFKRNINDGLNVEYIGGDDYRIKIVDPDSFDVYDIFTSEPIIMVDDNKSVVGSMDISLKSNAENLNLLTINRYSGYYNPIFKDILFYNDFENLLYSNTSFDYTYKDSYGEFGVIKNLWFHKVNDERKNIIKTLTPYYPLLNQYAIDYRDYNIWSSNGDADYFTKQIDINHSETCKNISSMKNNICMFGSKYLNVPETIEINGLAGGEEWNDDWVTNSDGCDGELMYKEVNNTSVDFYLFLRKRLLRYFCENENLKKEFEDHINPDYSYGLQGTLDDDIKEYVEKNILKLYKLDRIKVYIKREKMAIHNNRIENEYTNNGEQSISELKLQGFEESNTISVKKLNVDDFDRKVTYNLRNGEKEDFRFGFVVKKI